MLVSQRYTSSTNAPRREEQSIATAAPTAPLHAVALASSSIIHTTLGLHHVILKFMIQTSPLATARAEQVSGTATSKTTIPSTIDNASPSACFISLALSRLPFFYRHGECETEPQWVTVFNYFKYPPVARQVIRCTLFYIELFDPGSLVSRCRYVVECDI